MADSSKEKNSPLDIKASKLSITSILPSIKFLSIVVVVITAFCFFILPLLTPEKTSWSSGKLSTSHKLLENNCAACHETAFSEVQDKTCMNCHNTASFDHTSHSTYLAQHQNLNKNCRNCHFEHKGDASVISSDDRLCTNCHANVQQLKSDSTLQNVTKFNTHPKITLPEDKGLLKLNHAIHLKKDLKGVDGPVTLGCKDCHSLAADKKSFVPVSYESNCQACHPLTFDDSLPQSIAPHRDADAVVNFIFGAYSKVAVLGAHTESTKGLESIRNPSPAKSSFYQQDKVLSDAREAEKLLFTKTGCMLCHVVEQKTENGQISDTITLQSYYSIVKPDIPATWLPKIRFNHSAHSAMQCESCHTNVFASEDSKDLLIPGMDNCQTCHAGPVKGADFSHKGLNSNCVTCHAYHNSEHQAVSTANALSNILRGKK